MSSAGDCPQPSELQRAALGLLDDVAAARVEEHLATCVACTERLSNAECDDAFLEALRAQPRVSAELDERRSLLNELIPRLAQLATAAVRTAQTEVIGETTSSCSAGPGGREEAYCEFLSPAEAPDEIGRLGPYRVLQVLGAGGMGMVFAAEDSRLKRRVALKVMRSQLAAGESARKRFLREAQAAASVEHDNIVPIYQVGDERGIPFIAMPLLRGETLASWLARRQASLATPASTSAGAAAVSAWPLSEVLRIGREIAQGLAAAHESGLVHRDIKPANIWLEGDSGRVKLLDFGLARAVDEGEQITQAGALLGTPAYMSPEQARGQALDHRTDLFSLGCVLYQLATGVAPFARGETVATLMAVATADVQSPAQLNPNVPAELDRLILDLLAKQPADRPQSARDVVERLHQIESRPSSPPVADRPPPRRRRTLLALAAGGVLVLLAVVIVIRHKDGTITRIETDGEVTLESKLPDRAPAPTADDKASVDRAPNRPAPADAGMAPLTAPWPGLALRPAAYAGIARWQIVSRLSRGVVLWETNKPLAVSPDGQRLAIAGADAVVRIYEIATRRLERMLVGHESAVMCVAWSPDGQLLASGGSDRTIRLWQMPDGIARQVLRKHQTEVQALAWSADGERLASGGRWGESFIVIWRRTGMQLTLIPYAKLVQSLCWSPDGKWLAATGAESEIRLWTAEGKPGPVLPGHQGGARCVTWSRDGRRLASGGGDHTVRLWNAESWQEAAILKDFDRPIVGLAWSRNDRKLAVATENKDVAVYDAESRELRWSEYSPRLCDLAWSPDDRRLIAVTRWLEVRFWEADGSPGPRWEILAAQGGPAALSPDGHRVAFSAKERICIANADGSGILDLVDPDDLFETRRLAWRPDGKQLAAEDFLGAVRLWDPATGDAGAMWRLPRSAFTRAPLAWNSQKPELATGGGDKLVRIWSIDGKPGTEFASLPNNVFSIDWSADGRRLAAGGIGFVSLFDAAKSSQEAVIELAPAYAQAEALRWSPDGRLLALGEDLGAVRLYDAANRAGPVLKGQVLKGHTSNVFAFAWSPDQQWLASGGRDATCRLWKRDGAAGPVLHGHVGAVLAIAYSEDGRQVVTAGIDRTIIKWDAATGEPLQMTVLLPNNQVAVFEPDGRLKTATPGAEEQLVYVVEAPSGAAELLSPPEFRKRVTAASGDRQ